MKSDVASFFEKILDFVKLATLYQNMTISNRNSIFVLFVDESCPLFFIRFPKFINLSHAFMFVLFDTFRGLKKHSRHFKKRKNALITSGHYL